MMREEKNPEDLVIDALAKAKLSIEDWEDIQKEREIE